ncbi:MAG: hypothetical protein QM579_12855 [Desulfovibrio sp.]|uniref:hypothetical protein n=1 Tax=Desulfovibrio sp. TaxID=885 RepID=UPI0039E218F0
MMAAALGLLQNGGQRVAAAERILSDQPQVYWLPPETAFLWAWGLMLAFGAGMQALGLFFRQKFLVLAGAALVCGAAVMDRDPTLFVGQILLTAGLATLYVSRAKKQRAGVIRKPGRKHARISACPPSGE